ncbi:MAG: lysylphosphatidylglycerol synthase transmembrane domain-containing protein [Bacteroidota bacterium]
MKTRLQRYGILLLKIALSIGCLWYAFTKPDWVKITGSWRQIDLFWISLALGAYTLSKILASSRLNINFRLIGIQIPEHSNRKLYWLGMLYNLLLPGAITGDAYKVVVLGKSPGVSRKSLAMAVLLDRFSGLLSLLIILALLALYVLYPHYLAILFTIGTIAFVPISYYLIRWFLPQQSPGFKSTFVWGAGVQLLVLGTVYCVIRSIHLNDATVAYLLVFLLAAAASVLPISIGGGLGIREFASIQGAHLLDLSLESALLISLLFYGITVATALPGFAYIFKDPLKESN